jgi:hypothetical protein
MAHSLKARIFKSQRQAVTWQRRVNYNRGMLFSAQSMQMVVEYVMPSLSNNCTAIEERRFLCCPCREVMSRTKELAVAVSHRTARVQSLLAVAVRSW